MISLLLIVVLQTVDHVEINIIQYVADANGIKPDSNTKLTDKQMA